MQTIFKFMRGLPMLYFAMLLYGDPSIAQTKKVAELEQKLKKPLTDTARLSLLRKLSAAYSTVDPVKKFYYANRYKNMAAKLEMDSIVAEGYIDMGISYGIRSKIDSALYYFSKGYDIAKENNYDRGIARSHISMGFAYARLDDGQRAVDKYKEALAIYKRLKIIRGINQCYINIGSIYFDLQQYKFAERYFMASYKSYVEAKDEAGAAGAMFSLGNVNRTSGKFKKAADYYSKSLAIREKMGDLNGIALSRWGLGMIDIEEKKYEKALANLQIALKHDNTLNDTYHKSAVLLSIAKAYKGMKDYRKAEKNALEALTNGKSINSKIITSEAYEMLTGIAKNANNISKAFQYQTEYLEVMDSIEADKVIKDVMLKEFDRVRSENDGLVKDNKLISSKNTDYFKTILITSVLLVLVVILLLMVYRRNLEKQSINKLLQKQKEEIAAKNVELEKLNMVKNKFFSIVSHDLRSPLATLKMLLGLYRQEELGEAEFNQMLVRLEETIYSTSIFLDNLLEWSKNQLEGIMIKPAAFDTGKLIAENIGLMASQITLKGVIVENHSDDNVMAYADPNMINVVIRNLLSNSVKFCSEGDLITLEAKEVSGKVLLSVKDTGPGISPSDRKNLFNLEHTVSIGTSGETGHHIGLILCKEMVELNNGTITIGSEVGQGTIFFVRLPANPNS